MEKVVLKANKRDVVRKKLGALRREGKLPGVIYGKAIDAPLNVVFDLREASKLLRHVGSSTMLTLDVDGREIPTLVRERQRDFLKGDYIHIDFLAISLTEKVKAMVRIVLEGASPAVKDGGLLITGIEEIEVEALPQDLPENIHIDIGVLKEIGNGIHVADLTIPAGVELLTDPEEMIVVVTAPAVEVEAEVPAEVAEDLAEPEVIEKGKGDDEEAGTDG